MPLCGVRSGTAVAVVTARRRRPRSVQVERLHCPSAVPRTAAVPASGSAGSVPLYLTRSWHAAAAARWPPGTGLYLLCTERKELFARAVLELLRRLPDQIVTDLGNAAWSLGTEEGAVISGKRCRFSSLHVSKPRSSFIPRRLQAAPAAGQKRRSFTSARGETGYRGNGLHIPPVLTRLSRSRTFALAQPHEYAAPAPCQPFELLPRTP